MSDGVVGIVVLGNNWLEEVEKILESFSEELGFNFCDFIELYEGIFKDGLVIFIECLDGNLGHEWEDVDEVLGIFTFSNLQEVGYGLKSCEVNVEGFVLESLSKDLHKIALELNDMVHQV